MALSAAQLEHDQKGKYRKQANHPEWSSGAEVKGKETAAAAASALVAKDARAIVGQTG